jgi:hypothetical protein
LSAYAGHVIGDGPIGLVASLALAARGRVLLRTSRRAGTASRVDALPLPVIALLLELGIHPRSIGVEHVNDSILSTWESDNPAARSSGKKVHVDRALLERELRALVDRHSRIDVTPDPGDCLKADRFIDATGRRAVSAARIVEPGQPWFARTVQIAGRYGPAQQAMRMAPFERGYVYRIAASHLATVGIVSPDLPSAGGAEALLRAIHELGSGWVLAGLPTSPAVQAGRGGKASVQWSEGSTDWLRLGDAQFASDPLSSQGIATGFSGAMKLGERVSPKLPPALGLHLENLGRVIAWCRHRDAEAWSSYARFLRHAQSRVSGLSAPIGG